MDYQAKKQDPSLPKDFSKTIMEGSQADRAKMLFTYLGTKTDASIISLLPSELQAPVKTYLENYDPKSGKFQNPSYDPDQDVSPDNRQFVTTNQAYNDWANSILTVSLRKQAPSLPNNVGTIIREGSSDERLAMSYKFVASKLSDSVTNSLPPELRPLASTYLTNFDPTTGKVNNPKFDPAKAESKANPRYLDNNQTINVWAKDTFNQYVAKLDPSLPSNAGSVMMSGTDLERKKLAFSVVGAKLGNPIISALPDDLQPLAKSFMQNFDVEKGKVLAKDQLFTDWAGTMISKYIGANIPPEVMKLGLVYVNGGISALRDYFTEKGVDAAINLANQIQKKVDAFIGLAKEQLVVWVGKAIGVPVEQMKAYYDKYKQAQTLYKAFKAGKLDTAEAVLAVDKLLLDGAISKFVGKLDEALGLPAGSAQSLIMFAFTGNPVYIFQFAFALFFGVTIKCPNLQQEAQKNIDNLISAVLTIGQQNPALIPSQIITYNPDSFNKYIDKIKQVYAPCITVPNTRCGLFANSGFSRQVHIGF